MQTEPDIWICASGDYQALVTDEPPALKELVREALGVPVRRIGRFIQLALIGAGRCLAGQQAPANTAVYLGSGRGDLDVTLDVVEALFRQGLPPKPLSFVNTVSNAPNFYVAKHFNLAGRSNFVCNRFFPFEAALALAALDLRAGYTEAALVGALDLVTKPLSAHRGRLELAADAPVAEGSHWLYLRAGVRPAQTLGRLAAVVQFADQAALLAWLLSQALPVTETWLVPGQFMAAADTAAVVAATGLQLWPDAPLAPGYYDSALAALPAKFLAANDRRQLLLINREADGPRYSLLQITRT